MAKSVKKVKNIKKTEKDKIKNSVSELEKLPEFDIDVKEIYQDTSKDIQLMMEDRQDWVDRQFDYLMQWDNYIDSPVKPNFDNGSNFHVPLTMIMARAIHSRFHAAMFDFRPWFTVIPVESMDKETTKRVDRFMHWVLTDYVNYGQGIQEVVDDWLWDITTVGWGVLKRLWDRKFLNVLSREERLENEEQLISLAQDVNTAKQARKVAERLKLEEQFNGPVLETVDHIDFLMPGRSNRSSDLQSPHHICNVVEYDGHKMRQMADAGIMFGDAVDRLIKFKSSNRGSDSHIMMTGAQREAEYKRQQDDMQGVRGYDRKAGPTTYLLNESYRRMDINNDGYDEEVILWTSEDTKELVGWNFLNRVYPSGRRPLHKAGFIQRPRRNYPIGVVELLFPINQEINALRNQRVDFGSLQTAPFFFYRRSSSMKDEQINIEPGVGIPLDDPQRDVFFPRPPSNLGFQVSEEQALVQFAEKLTNIGDVTLGRVPSPVGGTRTVGGTAQLLDQAAVSMNVLIKRWQRVWGDVLHGLKEDISTKAKRGLEFRVLGSNGDFLLNKDGSPKKDFMDLNQLKMKVDYKFSANANNINRLQEIQDAIVLKQLLVQQAELQTGVITPANIYKLNKNILEKRGVLGIDEFLTEPQNIQNPLSLLQEITAIIQGQTPSVVINDNHEAKIKGLDIYFNSPEFQELNANGMANPGWQESLANTIQSHNEQLKMLQNVSQRAGNVQGAPGFQNPQIQPQGAVNGQDEAVGPEAGGAESV